MYVKRHAILQTLHSMHIPLAATTKQLLYSNNVVYLLYCMHFMQFILWKCRLFIFQFVWHSDGIPEKIFFENGCYKNKTNRSCADLEGDRGSAPTWKITKLYGSLSILVRITWKITKPPRQHSILGHHQSASVTPLKWCFAGGPMLARLYWYLDSLSPRQLHPPPQKKKKKKMLSELDHLWKNLLDPRMQVTLKQGKYPVGKKNAFENVVCWSRLLQVIAKHYWRIK